MPCCSPFQDVARPPRDRRSIGSRRVAVTVAGPCGRCNETVRIGLYARLMTVQILGLLRAGAGPRAAASRQGEEVGRRGEAGRRGEIGRRRDTARWGGVRQGRRGVAVLLTCVSAVGLAGCAPAGLRIDATSVGTSTAATTPTTTPTSAPTASATSATSATSTTATPPLPSVRTLDARATILADSGVPAELREPIATRCAGCGLDTTAYADVTGDGREEAIYAISDGNAVAGTLVYTMTASGPRRVFAHVGHQGWVEAVSGALRLTRQMYSTDDPRCCPTGPPEVSTYTWNGQAFALTRRTGGGVGFSPYDPKDRVIL